MGEVGVAFVVPRTGEVVDPDEVVAWCARAHGQLQGAARVEVVDALPANATGKVLKYELREQV